MYALVVASMEIGLEVNDEKTKYRVISWDQDAEQNHNIKKGNKLFQKVDQFKYLGTTLTNQNSIHEETKMSGKACFHSLQNLFVFLFAVQKNKD